MTTIERELPDPAAEDLLALAREIAGRELAPAAAAFEERGEFPRDIYRMLGRSGLLGLPYPEEYGGSGVPYTVYLQVLEELASAWLAVGIGVSVHTMACYPVASFGSEEQRRRWLPAALAGERLGAYSLSEPHAGSDAAALSTRAVRSGTAEDFHVTGTKAWVTHGGVADFYATMVRTSDDGARGVSCLMVDADTVGLAAMEPERKLGAHASPTAQLRFDDAVVPADRLVGGEGQGLAIALSALDSGRLGIAACAVGLAQAALDLASSYARERQQFGRPIGEFQGVSFLLADMATAVEASRALYLSAARRRDAGRPFGTQAAMAKLFATDAAMQVATDAIQVLGGAGYVKDFPAERYFREAKVLQIVEGTNQIQRLVIGRSLTGT